jgi:MFS family permease
MDTVGAAIGPLFALIFLLFYPGHYKTLFYIAFFPGVVAILMTFLLKEKRENAQEGQGRTTNGRKAGFFSYLSYWKVAPANYRLLISGLLIFALFNSSDAFLLLTMKFRNFSDIQIIGFYIFFNLVYALTAFPLGILADKIGLFRTLLAGLLLFSCIYFFFGFADSFLAFGILFFFYGIFNAATEGVSKALISNIADKSKVATAIGFYNSFASILTLVSSSLAGILWYTIGPAAMFAISGGGVLCAFIFLCLVFRKQM